MIKITRTTRISKHNRHFIFLRTLINAAVITTIRLRFDGRSTAYRTLLRSRWRNASAAADPLTVVTLTYLFIYLGLSTAATHSQAYDRNVGRQVVVVGVEVGSKSNRSCIRRVITPQDHHVHGARSSSFQAFRGIRYACSQTDGQAELA